MQLPDFLTLAPYEEILLTGSRIPLYTILRCRKEGYAAQQMAEEFDTVTLEHIEKVLAFCREHEAEVEAYYEATRAEIARQEAAPPGPAVLRIRRLLQEAREARKPQP